MGVVGYGRGRGGRVYFLEKGSRSDGSWFVSLDEGELTGGGRVVVFDQVPVMYGGGGDEEQDGGED